ncbi:hypothetical protein [Amycolatopsis sp. PS_44_ISF1]|uniref:hypothetical protein n=1 Tax=Amycolatopsis sp. PS_44_ISF1 TaxID=2974917 RepID=UPI0028DD614A|nr:hypothetical protein [Amycolatopsis sp. PS_44_ISF1]MDT8911467.1 hypothetical protein [Amycolatopsis sp. PS_44_ISF1]
MTHPQNPGPPPGSQNPGQQPEPGTQPYSGQPYSGQQPYPSQPFPAQPQDPGAQPQPYAGQPGQPFGQPSQPFGQPSQPFGAPPQPYGPPFPAYPGGPGSIQPPKPGGGTAITAAVLAILGGIASLVSVIGYIAIGAETSSLPVFVIVSLVVNLAMAGLLLFGAITLLMHKPIGRMCVTVGSGLAIAYTLITLVLHFADVSGLGGDTSAVMGFGVVASILWILPPVATLVLAIVKPTAWWVGRGGVRPGSPPHPGQPYPGGHPPQQGGGPQGW